MSDYTLYPENVDEVSILNDERIKTPIHRICLEEDSEHNIFNNDIKAYNDEGSRLTYVLNDIKLNEEEEESVIITISDSDYPDRVFEIDIQIHQVNSAFLISQMLKTPMFMIAPSDDVIASMSVGPFEKEEVKVTIEAPIRKTPEFTRISKKITQLSKHNEDAMPQLTVSNELVDEVRGQIIDVVTGLIKGDPKSLLLAYSFINPLNRTNDIDLKAKEDLTEEDKKALVMKDLLLKLEHSTHPISMSHLFSDAKDAREYTKDIEEFEAIISNSKISPKMLKGFDDSGFNITEDSSDEDVIAYINSPIQLKYIPAPLQTLLIDCDINYLWSFKWHSALEENVNFKELNPVGEFFVSILLVVAIRMARLSELYNISGNPDLSPMANMANGLTQNGEAFTWVVREAVRLLKDDKSEAIMDLLTIPPDLNIGRVSGPVSIILHGIAHAALELDMPESSVLSSLDGEGSIASFLQKMYEIRGTMPDVINTLNDENTCFIRGLVFGYLQDGVTVTKDYAAEMIRSVQILAELTIMRKISSPMSSPEWKEAEKEFYSKLLR